MLIVALRLLIDVLTPALLALRRTRKQLGAAGSI
jgi:hypothetical protein